MLCGDCGFEAAPDFAFCPKCGRALARACPACGFAGPADFVFCPRCGGRLPASLPGPASLPAPDRAASGRGATPRGHDDAADRRPVTVLFADLSNFTGLGERRDAEEIRALQSELFQAMAGVIESHGGFVEKFVGDAVMAVFGAPTAHEDDPERALRAALALHDGVGTLNARWAARLGAPLALHVGVNTGSVVAGTLGAASDAAYAVTGDTVNTAARLQSAAQPGQTLVGAITHRLTQHAFAFEAIGDPALKGKVARQAVYRLLGPSDVPRPARGLEGHGLAAPLVGRDDDLVRMRAAFERAMHGRAEVVSLIGEAGAGKSRLLREFFARLETSGRLEGVATRRAACASLGERTYGVLAALFRDAYGVAAGDTLEAAEAKLRRGLGRLGAGDEEHARVVWVLRYVLGLGSGTEADLDPETLKRQIFLALRLLFERRLAQAPLVVVVEDLHWADAASVEFLRFIVDRLVDRPLLLLFAYRPTFEDRGLVPTRAAHTAIRLGPLSEPDSASLLDGFFGPSVAALPPALRALIVERAGGNPFFLEEIVRGLIATGALVRDDPGWRCAASPEAAGIDVPLSIHGLLLSRVDRLPAGARRVAQEAAVLGSVFEPRLLRMIANEPAGCDAALDLLQAAELVEEIVPPPGGIGPVGPVPATVRQYRFTHALVHDVVYQNLLLRQRSELHERAGQALEALCERDRRPRRLEDLEALGYHFSASPDKLKGARYLLAAGDWARTIYANADAVRYYEAALRALEECEAGATEQLGAWERLADLDGLAGRRDVALQRYGAVLRAAEASGDRAAEARVHRKIGGLHWSAGERERALAALETGLALLEGHEEELELAHLSQEMGRLAFRSGDNARAIEWATRALAQAERLASRGGDTGTVAEETRREAPAAISHAYNTLGIALARTGRVTEAVQHIERSVSVAEAHGLLQVACRGYANLGVLYSTADPRRSIETCRRGLEVAKKIGDLGFQSRLYANLAVAYCAFTDRCDADGIAAAQAAIDLDRQLGELDHLAVPLIVLAQIYQCHGEPDLALRYYGEALALTEGGGEPQFLVPCYDGLATVYLDRDDPERAEEYMRKAQDVCQRAGIEPDALMVLPFLS